MPELNLHFRDVGGALVDLAAMLNKPSEHSSGDWTQAM